jgi:hypothetical protein
VSEPAQPDFPAALLTWAGHRSGGVRRLFDESSGRPGGKVLTTNLLNRLEAWASAYARAEAGTPRILLLVGGPGNGKTEAIESTIGWLDEASQSGGELVATLGRLFSPASGLVPRLVAVELGRQGGSGAILSVVQDASVVTAGDGKSSARCLIDELGQAIASDGVYLCCVNRGVLDDALIEAIDTGDDAARRLLETVTRAVSLSTKAPGCWPLDDHPSVAVWPMDTESLLVEPSAGGAAPALTLLQSALEQSRWPPAGACAAGDWCPFCTSREHLGRPRELEALSRILRSYEVGSGKRWSFRDLFSLSSYLLAGHHADAKAQVTDPCQWAASLVQADSQATRGVKPVREASTAIFQLVAAQYQHALFHRWDKEAGPALLRDLKELDLDDDPTAMGLQWFLSSRRRQYLPATIGPSLEDLAEMLDPALASPETEVQATSRTAFALRDVDLRFSRALGEGLDFLRKLHVLPKVEFELLGRLSRLDALLSEHAIRRKRPAVAARVQRLVRDFACRLVRRTLGAKCGAVLDADVLADYKLVCEDEGGDRLYDVAREVERLLNANQDFEISLTTTFGQPLPPPTRRALLVVPARPVRPLGTASGNRPRTPLPFLSVGGGASAQPIALTYELFRAIRELQRGMSPASLPRSVLALIDTTRARLAGPIVRDREILDRARIVFGAAGVAVEERRSGFGTIREGGR